MISASRSRSINLRRASRAAPLDAIHPVTPTPPVSRREINRRYVPPPSHEPHVAPKRHGLRRPARSVASGEGARPMRSVLRCCRCSSSTHCSYLSASSSSRTETQSGRSPRRGTRPRRRVCRAVPASSLSDSRQEPRACTSLTRASEACGRSADRRARNRRWNVVASCVSVGHECRRSGSRAAEPPVRGSNGACRFAVVCDCLDPPFAAGAFDLLVSNNFLHHVSSKRETLSRWARIARVIMFSENTRYWATSWPAPFILRRLGLRNAAERVTARSRSRISRICSADGPRRADGRGFELRVARYLLQRATFFIAATFSTLMRCTGPPTPSVVKALLLGPLRALSLPLTRRIARDLICYDALADRGRDVYVLYVLESRAWQRSDDELICPQCGASLNGVVCSSCGTRFPEADGMVFVLPDALAHIERDYDAIAGAAQSAEQL